MKHIKRKTFPILLILGITLFFVTKSSTQNITWYGHLDETDGLSERIVEKVVRSNDGNFYFFTPKSIQKYDGKSIDNINSDVYLHEHKGIQTITNNVDINPLVLIENDLSKSFVLENNQLNTLIQSPLIESFNSKDSIFISGNNHTSYIFEKIAEKKYNVYDIFSTKLLIENINLNSLPYTCYVHPKNDFIITQDINNNLELVSNVKSKLSIPKNGCIVLRNDTLIINDRNGIYKVSNNKLDTIIQFENKLAKPYWAKADQSGNVLFTYNKTIATIKEIVLLKSDNTISDYSQLIQLTEHIKDVYAEDFTTKMILGTFNGVYIVNLKNKGINSYYVRPNLAISEFGNVISGVKWSNVDSSVYFIRETRGLFRLNKDKSIDTVFTHEPYINNNFLSINESQDKLYSSSFNTEAGGSFHVYDVKSSRVTSTPVDFLIQTICPIDDSQVFLGGGKKAMNFLRETGKAYAALYNIVSKELDPITLPTQIIPHQIRSAYFDKENNELWIGTINGLFRLNSDFTLKEIYNADQESEAKIIYEPHIRMIKKINNHIYIGCLTSGLYIIDPKISEIVSHLNKQNSGLSANSIICVENDQFDKIWAGSFSGMNLINAPNEVLEKFHFNSGISNPEFNTMASTKDAEGKLYFGTINGLTEIDPKITFSSIQKHVLNIEDIIIYNKGSLKHVNSSEKEIELPEGVDSVSIKYNFPDYHKFHFNHDKEYLEIIEKGSFSTQFNNELVTIKDLKLGLNTLGLKPKNTTEKTQMIFSVKRNYLPYFITILSLLLIGGLLSFFRYQRVQSRKRLEEEKLKFTKKLAEMELTALRAQMNPHFIFNALGAIQYFINTQNVRQADDYLTKFAKLMRSILESTKSKYIRLEDEINLLQLYTSLEHIRFEEKFDYSVDIDSSLDVGLIKIPSMIIQPFVENAINHGLYHLHDRKGSLKISFIEIAEDKMRCVIEDNGIGRAAAMKKKTNKTHKSRGMQIVNERIEALKIANNYDIEINISDPKVNTGTIVEIDIHFKYYL